VFAPNQLGQAQDGTPELSPTGWLRVRNADGAVQTDAAQSTEYQQAFRSIVDTVRNHPWGAHEPYFDRLEIRVDLPGMDFALPVDENAQVISGALEQSNVNPSEVLVDMISAQRLFEMRTKLVETARQVDEGGVRLMRIDS
jgi:hypothetical protein